MKLGIFSGAPVSFQEHRYLFRSTDVLPVSFRYLLGIFSGAPASVLSYKNYNKKLVSGPSRGTVLLAKARFGEAAQCEVFSTFFG